MPSLLNYYWFNLPLFRSRLRAKSQVKVHSQIGKRKVGQLSDGHDCITSFIKAQSLSPLVSREGD